MRGSQVYNSQNKEDLAGKKPVAVVGKSADGTTTQGTLASPEQVAQTTKQVKKLTPPGGKVQIKDPEEEIAERVTDRAKEEKPKHEFSSTQVSLPPQIAQKLRAFGERVLDSDLAEDGREDEPHITVKYGLHGEDPEAIRRLLAEERPIRLKLGKTSLFKNDDQDVLKVNVDSKDLHRLNKKISDALPHTDTHPGYKPHATIAYLKKGKGDKYSGMKDLEGAEAILDQIVFSSKSGEKYKITLRPPSAASGKSQLLDSITKLAKQGKFETVLRLAKKATDSGELTHDQIDQALDAADVPALKEESAPPPNSRFKMPPPGALTTPPHSRR